ncbi:hypothetical protein [Planctomyces sp. SH-PL14]|uniref:hypothetical protein n=1 Tax=Planctomyces sp. SH-PL14 TaxID=1632864 RepID=UPI00078DA33D|nr:hypothetical protein [Planctomyces sp. SH-PL14]AMV20917.1 hypothetical protein VT03_23650 [Planctomyces sp. SH-PL14]
MPIWGWVCLGLPAALAAFLAYITWQFGRQQARLKERGRTVVARILFADPVLYDRNNGATFSAAFVVFTMSADTSPAHLESLRTICERLDGFQPQSDDEDELKIGAALQQQTTAGQIPLRIPNRITQGKEVYFATPNVMRRMLPGGRLLKEYIYLKVLIEGDTRELAMIEYPDEG